MIKPRTLKSGDVVLWQAPGEQIKKAQVLANDKDCKNLIIDFRTMSPDDVIDCPYDQAKKNIKKLL